MFALGQEQVVGSPEVNGFFDGGDRTGDGTGLSACDGRLGFSVSSASFGDGGDPAQYMARLAGCPGEPGELGGFIAMTARDSESTRDPITMAHYDEVILMDGSFNLGGSILGADVLDCYGPVSGVGCGDEVLVGAPNLAGPGKGRVRWFTLDNGGRETPDLAHQGDITAPGSLPGGAQFGSSLAAPHELADPDTPWDDVPYDTRWVAVGAPGASIWEDGAGFTNITFLEPFDVWLHDGGTTSDDRCTYTDDGGDVRDSITIPADTHMPLADSWTCTGGTAGTQTFSMVPAEPVIAAWSLAARGVAEAPTGHKIVLTMGYEPNGAFSTDDDVEITFDISDLPLDDLELDEDCNIPGPLSGDWADWVTE